VKLKGSSMGCLLLSRRRIDSNKTKKQNIHTVNTIGGVVNGHEVNPMYEDILELSQPAWNNVSEPTRTYEYVVTNSNPGPVYADVNDYEQLKDHTYSIGGAYSALVPHSATGCIQANDDYEQPNDIAQYVPHAYTNLPPD